MAQPAICMAQPAIWWANPLQTLSQGLVLTLRFTFGSELDNLGLDLELGLWLVNYVVIKEYIYNL